MFRFIVVILVFITIAYISNNYRKYEVDSSFFDVSLSIAILSGIAWEYTHFADKNVYDVYFVMCIVLLFFSVISTTLYGSYNVSKLGFSYIILLSLYRITITQNSLSNVFTILYIVLIFWLMKIVDDEDKKLNDGYVGLP